MTVEPAGVCRLELEEALPSYSMPYVCFACRRSFKHARRFGDEGRRGECAACHGPSIALHPHFKAPRRDDLKQWQKVQFLIEHGFYFWPLKDRANHNEVVKYPATLVEARDWVKRWQHIADANAALRTSSDQ